MMNFPLAAQSTDLPPQQPALATAPALLEPLQQALKAKKWALADQETRRLFDPSSVESRNPPEIKLTPELIRSIDQAWNEASGGRFSLSVQAKIWREVKQQFPNDERAAIEAMRDRVGWKLTQPRKENDGSTGSPVRGTRYGFSYIRPCSKLAQIAHSHEGQGLGAEKCV
ncbi:MAG: hypothetical protein HC860_23125 [Alkalinema sp. RU_4_3]|nr:hypothetical protein [Alkalinema sp. RU_4_3]